jgi:hypothetical protein
MKEPTQTFSKKNVDAWVKGVSANQDDYGYAVYEYAAKWANLMEREMATGKSVALIAKDTSHEADKEIGITGFMYGCAVSVLAEVWEHGDELRRWHNLDIQIKDEGEKANETGGVLNPAVLNVR